MKYEYHKFSSVKYNYSGQLFDIILAKKHIEHSFFIFLLRTPGQDTKRLIKRNNKLFNNCDCTS